MSDAVTIVQDGCDRAAWNAFVEASPHGHFFQSWEWGELQAGLEAPPRRLAALRNGAIAGALQLIMFETGPDRRFGFVPRGPVADPADTEVVHALVDAAIDVCARAGAFLLRFEPQWERTPEAVELMTSRGFGVAKQRIMPLRTALVDISRPADAIWAGFHSNTRNRIRLAQKQGVEVRVARGDEMATFLSLFDETTTRHGMRKADTDAMRLSVRHFGERDAMRLYLASHEGVDISGIIVFVGSGWATYLWGASSAADAARKANPNQLLHWTAMQWGKERGCHTYDLYGIPDYDEEVLEAEYHRQTGGMWNLYKFKRGFGVKIHRHAGTFDAVFAKRPAAAAPEAS
jgi:lipid II:glycine glycyltransferase (peptidoglycan interpeptide bridge formation enzyme)